jgi:hypothetical protein
MPESLFAAKACGTGTAKKDAKAKAANAEAGRAASDAANARGMTGAPPLRPLPVDAHTVYIRYSVFDYPCNSIIRVFHLLCSGFSFVSTCD